MAAFTTIATGIGLAVTAATTGKSFAQASKQKKLQEKAEREADKQMAEAKSQLDLNFYEGLAIQKEPYELEREAILSTAANIVQAGREGEQRGAGVTAGRTFLAAQGAQADVSSRMGQEMAGLEKLAAAEESRLAGKKYDLALSEVQGSQLAARDAMEASNVAKQQAMQGVGNIIQQGLQFIPEYQKSGGARQAGRMDRMGATSQDIQTALTQQGNTLNGVDISGVSNMDELQLQDFLGQQSADWNRKLRKDILGLEGFNPFNIF